jgi:hypothetical protein
MVKIEKDLDEKWKIAIVESLDFIVWGSFQHCTFLETWTKMPHYIYYKTLVVNRRYTYESCGKRHHLKNN